MSEQTILFMWCPECDGMTHFVMVGADLAECRACGELVDYLPVVPTEHDSTFRATRDG